VAAVVGKITILAVAEDHPNRLAIKVVGMVVAMLHIPDKNNQVFVKTISIVNDIDNKEKYWVE
jgi:hypothetical protein